MLGMLALSQCAWQPVEAADSPQCATVADEAAWASIEGMGEPTDYVVGANTLRVRKHDDHYDVALFTDGCVAGVKTDLSPEDLNRLLKAFEGQGL
jgi:hypothetical protein